MPESMGSISINKIVYEWIKKSDSWICHIHPNVVTLLNFGLTCLIGYLIYTNQQHYGWIYGLVIVRSLLDIMDGGIARKCDKTSTLGKYLDLIGDAIFFIMICGLIYLKVKPNKYIYLLLVISVMISVWVTYQSLLKDYEIIKENQLLLLMHDNGLITGVFLVMILQYLKIIT